MNEEAIGVAYDLFVSDGYTKSIEDFKQLMKSNAEAQAVAYDLFVGDGYGKSMQEFNTLMGAGILNEQNTPQDGIIKPKVETTPRIGTEILPGESYRSTDDELIDSDIVPQEGVETLTEATSYDETEKGGTLDVTTIGENDIVYDKNATPLERSLAFVNRDFFSRDEEPVVNRLKYHFTDYGFKFEESGLTDNVTVTAPNKKKETFAIDSSLSADDGQEARALRDFIRNNQREAGEVDQIESQYDKSRKKYFSREAVDADIAYIRKQSEESGREMKEYFKRRDLYDQQMQAYSDAPGTLTEEDYKLQLEEGKFLDKEKNRLAKNYQLFKDNAAQVDVAVGNYIGMKERDGSLGGTIAGGLYNKLLGFFDSSLTTVGGTGIDAFYAVAQGIGGNDYDLDPEEYRSEFIRVFEGYKKENAPDSAKASEEGFNAWVETLKGKEDVKELFNEDGSVNKNKLVSISGANIKGELQSGGAFGDDFIIIKEDPRLKRLPPDIYDVSKGVKIEKKSPGIGLGQPRLEYENPLVWSLQEEDWVDAPNMMNLDNVYDQIDDMVGDQKVKKSKKWFKDRSRHALQDLIGVGNVSEERMEAQMNQGGVMGVVATGVYGAAESLPALAPMIYGAYKNKKLAIPKGKSGKTLKDFGKRFAKSIKNFATDGYRQASLIGMATLHADKLNEQIEKNPDMEWVTENEKKAIVLPLTITSAILETLGFRMLLKGVSGTQLITSVTTKALNQLPKGATPAMFRRAVINIMDNRVTRGIGSSAVGRFAGRTIPASLAEAETGALQEMTDIAGKDLYNSIKGKDMFDNPDTWSTEYFKQVGFSAAAEAVGGFALGTPGGLISAFSGKNEITEITEDMVVMFDKLKSDETYVESYKTNLDLDVSQGLISRIEAKSKLLDFNTLRAAAMDLDIASDLTKSQKTQALKLVFQKRKLETEMGTMDKDLGSYKEKQLQLDAITELLGQLGTSQAESQADLKKEQENIPDYVSEEQAVVELKKEGIENPSPEQIKTKQDALQKQSTESLDAPKSTESSSEVGQDVSSSELTGKSSSKNEVKNREETQEEVEPSDEVLKIQKKRDALIAKINDTKAKRDAKSAYNKNFEQPDSPAKDAERSRLAKIIEAFRLEDNADFKKLGELEQQEDAAIARQKELSEANTQEEENQEEIDSTPIKPTKKLKNDFENNTLSLSDRIGMLYNAFVKKKDGKKLTSFEETLISSSDAALTWDIRFDIDERRSSQAQRRPYVKPDFDVLGKTKTETKSEETLITDGKVGDTFTSERGEETIIKKTKGKTITKNNNETILPEEQRKNGLKGTTKLMEQLFPEEMANNKPVPVINIYTNGTSQTTSTLKTEEDVTEQSKEDVDAFFDENLESVEVVSPSISRNKSKVPVEPKTKAIDLLKNVKKAAKAIAKIFPDVRFVMHDSTVLFTEATGKKGRGYFDPNSQTIHINMETADLDTPYHEAVHAMTNQLIATDAAAAKVFSRLLVSLDKILPQQNNNLKERLDKFVKQYEAGEQSEEAGSQLMGILAAEYKNLKKPTQRKIIDLINRFLKKLGISSPFNASFNKSDDAVMDFFNTVSGKLGRGETINEQDLSVLTNLNPDEELDTEQEQGDSGQVGTFTFKGKEQKAPEIKNDTRSFAKNITQKDLKEYKGKKFITNMYDFTNAGPTDIGAGIVLDLYGGKNYVADMMEKTGAKLGEVSNVAAFNTKENAQGFISNSIESGASLFAPHVGTKEGSWQFQQNIFEQLTYKLLDNNILTNKELIGAFNSGLKSKDGKKALKKFNKKYGKKLTNLNEFKNNPKELVELLDINNNYSPDLRKILNDKIAASKKVQEALGIKNKIQFSELLEDPMNKGSKAFDIIGVIEFDNTTFEAPAKPKKGDKDYHPSFAWTVRAKINAIVQPTEFYQSTEVTDSYTKYNKDGVKISTRENTENYKSSNVSSSAGSIPKVGKVKSEVRKGKEQTTEANVIQQTGMPGNGYFSPQAMVHDIQRQFNRIGPGYKVKRAKVTPQGYGGGVYVLSPRGKRVVPNDIANSKRKGRLQKVFRAGDLVTKAEPIFKFDGQRSTGHFGTGFYFFSNQKDAQAYAKRTGTQTSSRIVSNLDLDNYNLAPGTLSLHKKLKIINDEYSSYQFLKKSDKKVSPYDIESVANTLDINISEDLLEKYSESVTKKLRSTENKDTASTLVMKELGFEGVDATNTKLDNSIYGTVVYDIKASTRIGREQLMDTENQAMKIVMLGREEGGFKDSEISYYLKRKGFKAKEIKDALSIDTDIFTPFPKSFANIEGGLKAGVSLLAKLNKFHNKVIKENDNKKKYKQESLIKLVNRTIEHMYTLKEYTDLGVAGNRLTAQQQALEVDLLNYLSPNVSAFNGLRVSELNKSIKNIKFNERNIKKIQRNLRQYIRSVMPRNLLGKAQYMKLIDLINSVDETNYNTVLAEVTDTATTITNKNLNQKILDVLNNSFTEIQSGRSKGVKITQEVKDRIHNIAKNILGYVPGKKGQQGTIGLLDLASNNSILNTEIIASEENLREQIRNLETEEVKINGETQIINRTLTPEEAQEVADLVIAIQYNNSLQMTSDDANMTNAFEQVAFNLNQLQEYGVSGFQLLLLKDSSKYMNNAINVLTDMGAKIDPLQSLKDEGKENITQGDVLKKFRELKNKIKIDAARSKINKISVTKRLVLHVKEIGKYAYRKLGTAEDLTGLMDRVSLSTGELFGGVTQEIVTQEIRKASRTYKGRMLNHELALSIKMTDLFGKKWLKVNKNHNTQNESIVVSTAKQIILEQERSRVLKDSKLSSGEQEVLVQAIDKEINSNTIPISQNELLYYRNQSQDPSLEKSFETTFEPTPFEGDLSYLNKVYQNENEFSARIKNEINEKLNDNLIKLGDWMIHDFFPNQYSNYNDTYKKIYRTDMPWNKHYAGRLYRENDADIVGIDLLDAPGNKSWISNVNTASTKFRVASDSKIMQVNAVDAMLNYTRDMEYFAAYAVPVRNIHKIFSDSSVKAVISERFGNDINRYINDQITKIANKGAKHQKQAGLINFFNNTFLLSRLGLNPTLILKQMTSFVTYGNDIGYGNWLKYSGKTGWSGISADMKEIMANSVVLQDRYGSPITRVLETYQDESFRKLDGANNVINEHFDKDLQNTLVKALMSFTMMGDKGAIMLGGLPNYRFYKAQAIADGKSEQEAIDFAIIKFEADTLRTQQSYDLQDKDYWQTSNAFARAFNMFLTTPKQYFRREIIAARNLSRIVRTRKYSKESGKKEGKGTIFENARSLVVYHAVMPTFFKYVSLGMPGLFRDRREDDLEALGISALLGNLNAIFILGDLMNMYIDRKTGKPWGNTPPSIPLFEQAARLNMLRSRADNTKDPVKKAEYEMKYYLELTTLVGAPTPQLKRFMDNWGDLATGDVKGFGDAFLKAFNFSKYVQEGRQKRKPAKPRPIKMTKSEMKRYYPEEYRQQELDKKEYESEYSEEIREQELAEQEAKKEYRKLMDEYYLDN